MKLATITATLLLLIAAPFTATAQTAAPRHRAAPPHHRAYRAQKAALSAGRQVWVNTNSGLYRHAGQRWYGNTSRGRYMSEAAAKAAKAAGYRATENGQ